MDIVDLPVPTTKNWPGAGSFIFVAELEHIATYGAAATVTVYGDELRIDGDHVFDTGKGFRKWETIDDTFEVMSPVTGSTGALAMKPNFEIYLPGITKQKLYAATENKSFMVLIPIFGCDSTTYLQIGDACNPARIMPSDGMKTGKSRSNDPRGVWVKFEGYGTVYLYEGDVDIAWA
jgi:hypothetical protein